MCDIQLTFFSIFVVSEISFLSAMSYDHYVAICNPLLYTVIMSQRFYQLLVVIPYLCRVFLSLVIIIKIFISLLCVYNVTKHFKCDSLPLISLLCSDTHEIKLLILIFSVFNWVPYVLIVLVSYMLTFVAILRGRGQAQGFLHLWI